MNGANLSLPEPIELVALDPARNIRRRYSITASLDLFGMIVVEARWGRIGAHGQAQRHAFADRAKLLGDPAFVKVPLAELSSADYAKARAAQLLPDQILPAGSYGRPGGDKPLSAPNDHGTSHICVIDREGNVAALTTTVNLSFGSHVIAGRTGVILNDQMDDFAAQPGVPNTFQLVMGEANAIAPGKIPVSSMTPSSMAPMSMPNSRVLVQMAEAGSSFCFRAASVSERISFDRLPWWGQNSYGTFCSSHILFSRCVYRST